MKKQKLLLAVLAIFILRFDVLASLPISSTSPTPQAGINHYPQATKTDQARVAQMKAFVSLTADEYGKLSGKHLNFLERISFRTSQHRMKQMLKYYEYGEGPSTLQKIGALLKGLLFGPLAIILGYLFLKDDDRELIKWIWFGFAGFAIILTIILLSL